MGRDSIKIFSLAEANEAVKEVDHLTRDVVLKINRLQERYEQTETDAELPASAMQEVEALLREWSETVESLGARPKGFFTVDFQSMDPGLFYCWTYGEAEIGFTHKVWENFTHRRPLVEASPAGAAHFKWVN
jgi:hypothetical protein